jgi:hypothetical protein
MTKLEQVPWPDPRPTNAKEMMEFAKEFALEHWHAEVEGDFAILGDDGGFVEPWDGFESDQPEEVTEFCRGVGAEFSDEGVQNFAVIATGTEIVAGTTDVLRAVLMIMAGDVRGGRATGRFIMESQFSEWTEATEIEPGTDVDIVCEAMMERAASGQGQPRA